MKPQRKLKNIKIREISVVDKAANDEDEFLVLKRDNAKKAEIAGT